MVIPELPASPPKESPQLSQSEHVKAFVQHLRGLSMHFMRVAMEGSQVHREMTKQELLALSALREAAPCRMGDLAELLGVVQSAVTPLVDRLEERGLASRSRSTDDRRVWLVELTADGREAVEADDAGYEAVAAEMLAPLTESEQATLMKLMAKIAG